MLSIKIPELYKAIFRAREKKKITLPHYKKIFLLYLQKTQTLEKRSIYICNRDEILLSVIMFANSPCDQDVLAFHEITLCYQSLVAFKSICKFKNDEINNNNNVNRTLSILTKEQHAQHGSPTVPFVILFRKTFCVLQAFTCTFPVITEYAALL